MPALLSLAKLREGSAEIGKEAARDNAILNYRAWSKGEGERPDLSLEDLFQAGLALNHERCEESNAFRFSMARAYSRQTSCGASST